MESASIVRHKRDGRWAAYEARTIKPRGLEGHTNTVHARSVHALAVGLDGKVYSGSYDKTIMVWSGESGAHLQTLTWHTDGVRALVVGLDGNIYSGSLDRTVRVWSGASGAHVRTLEGHTGWVVALAVGLDGKIYSGSGDETIRVWAAGDGAHLQTLVGHTHWVSALAVGKKVPSTLAHTIKPSGCGLARTAPTSAPSRVTQTMSSHSQWHLTADCTRGRPTRRFGCGLPTIASTCIPLRDTRARSKRS
jgi:WD40 repeat protein